MRKQEFSYAIANIKSNMFDTEFDIRNSIIELDIYENLAVPYLTGRIMFTDTNSFFNNINFTGTEILEIQIENLELGRTALLKEFVMTKIETSERVNDTTEVFVFELIEKHGFDSMAEKISKAYTGNPLTIISHILADFTDKTLDKELLDTDPIQEEMRVIIPYLQPLHAIEWIKDRATSVSGYPFFVFASMKSDNILVNSLENIITTTPWNDIPFVYSQPTGAADDEVSGVHTIKSIKQSNVDDTLSAIMLGAVGTRFEVLDTLTGNQNSDLTKQHSIDKTLKQPEKKNAIFDASIEIKNKRLDELESKVFFNVITGNRYNDDVNGYHDEIDLDKQVSKIKNKSLRAALAKNSINIELSGIPFLINDLATVGSQIRIHILGRRPGGGDIDKKKSGNYTILALRHQYKETSWSITGKVTKLTNEGESVGL